VDLLALQAASIQKLSAIKLNALMVATAHSTLTLIMENALPENNAHVSTVTKFSKPENDFDEIVTNVSVWEVTSTALKTNAMEFVPSKKVTYELLMVKNTISTANVLTLSGKPLINLSVLL
jgi:hypothetical protein